MGGGKNIGNSLSLETASSDWSKEGGGENLTRIPQKKNPMTSKSTSRKMATWETGRAAEENEARPSLILKAYPRESPKRRKGSASIRGGREENMSDRGYRIAFSD